MKLNNDEITTLLRENGEPASEFLNHFGNFLRHNEQIYNGFQTNEHYSTYVKNALSKGSLPSTTQFIIDSNHTLASRSEELLSKSSYRP